MEPKQNCDYITGRCATVMSNILQSGKSAAYYMYSQMDHSLQCLAVLFVYQAVMLPVWNLLMVQDKKFLSI